MSVQTSTARKTASHRHWTSLAGAFLICFSLSVSAGEWVTDFDKGLARAKKEHKDIFLLITGSDWCIWCKRLEGEVLSKNAFLDNVPKHFVLVKLDFPRHRQIPEAQRKRNRAVMRKYGARGYPTVFLLDSKGIPYAKTGYRPGGPEKYVQFLEKQRKAHVERDKKFALAEKAHGIGKAKLLDQALEGMDPVTITKWYKDIVETIITLDQGNKAGLKNKYLAIKALSKIEDLKRQRNSAGALAKIDEVLEKYEPTGQIAQDLHFMRSEFLFFAGKKDQAKAELETALQAAPKGDKVGTIRRVLKRYFSD